MRRLNIDISHKNLGNLRVLAERDYREPAMEAAYLIEQYSARILRGEAGPGLSAEMTADTRMRVQFSERLLTQVWECGQLQGHETRREAGYLLAWAIAEELEQARIHAAKLIVQPQSPSEILVLA